MVPFVNMASMRRVTAKPPTMLMLASTTAASPNHFATPEPVAPEVAAERLRTARRELAAQGEFDHRVVNDDVGRAADEVVALVEG